MVDRECRPVSFNDAYCQIFGVTSKQLRRAVLTDFVCETDRELAKALYQQLLNGGAPSNTFAGRLTADGAPVLIRSNDWAVRQSPGAPPRASLIANSLFFAPRVVGLIPRGAAPPPAR